MPPAALAERETFLPTLEQIEGPEVYARSTRVLMVLGRLASDNALMTPEGHSAYEEGFNDFRSAVEENLTTDPDHGEALKFNPVRTYKIVDGQTVDKNGMPVAEMVGNGLRASTKAALTDKEMTTQVERDEGDVMIADIVDSLEVGEMYAVVSMEPKAALVRNPRLWRDRLGYREGMAVIQTYHKDSVNKLTAGAYSVKQSSMPVFRRIFARHGVNIPEGESENRWSRYGIRKQANEEEALAFGPQLHEEHRLAVAPHADVHSVTELLKRHQDTVKTYFDTYIVPLSVSRVTGKNNSASSSLASTLLTQPDLAKRFGSDEVHALMRVANISSSISAEDASFMEERVRYALVEDLRQHLPQFIASNIQSVQEPVQLTPAIEPVPPTRINMQFDPSQLQFMNNHLAARIADGVRAGRTYGGCSGAGKTYEETLKEMGVENVFGTQDVFGGKAEGEHRKSGEDKYGSLTFKCQNGHVNTRPYNKFVKHCKTCKIDMSCGKDDD